MKLLPVLTGLVFVSTFAVAGVMSEELIEPTLDVAKELAVAEQPVTETFGEKLESFLKFALLSLILII